MSEYKPNSHKAKIMEKENLPEKNVKKIVKGKVMVKKKNEISKVKDALIAEDTKNVMSYLGMDVLIPAIKKAISDIVTNGIDMLLFGDSGRSRRNSNIGGVSYRNYYDKKDNDRFGPSRQERNGYIQNDVIVETRGEAEEILDSMTDLISTYGVASVADFNEFAGLKIEYTDNKYGWTNLRNAEIKRVREGYMIRLPKAMAID